MKNISSRLVFTFAALIALILVVPSSIEGKGGRGGGGGGGRYGGGYSRGGRSTGKKAAVATAVGGVAGYALYKAHKSNQSPHRFHTNPLNNLAFFSGGGGKTNLHPTEDPDYIVQESSYYNRKESWGLSAFGLLCIVLGIVGTGTLAWFCYTIGVPMFKDWKRGYREEDHQIPLHQTPSTATPSP